MRRVAFALMTLAVLALPAAAGMENLVLRNMDGERVYVDSLLAEGPVVLNFWATWCRPCRVEMPQLQKLHKQLEGKQVHIAAISLDSRRHKSKIEAYIEENEVLLPVYRDPEGTLARKFKVVAIPTTILLDQEAEIAYKARGYRPGDEILLKKEIEALLGKRDEEPEQEQASE
jgi:thiol-disulfide isomerase/thioredoxin